MAINNNTGLTTQDSTASSMTQSSTAAPSSTLTAATASSSTLTTATTAAPSLSTVNVGGTILPSLFPLMPVQSSSTAQSTPVVAPTTPQSSTAELSSATVKVTVDEKNRTVSVSSSASSTTAPTPPQVEQPAQTVSATVTTAATTTQSTPSTQSENQTSKSATTAATAPVVTPAPVAATATDATASTVAATAPTPMISTTTVPTYVSLTPSASPAPSASTSSSTSSSLSSLNLTSSSSSTSTSSTSTSTARKSPSAQELAELDIISYLICAEAKPAAKPAATSTTKPTIFSSLAFTAEQFIGMIESRYTNQESRDANQAAPQAAAKLNITAAHDVIVDDNDAHDSSEDEDDKAPSATPKNGKRMPSAEWMSSMKHEIRKLFKQLREEHAKHYDPDNAGNIHNSPLSVKRGAKLFVALNVFANVLEHGIGQTGQDGGDTKAEKFIRNLFFSMFNARESDFDVLLQEAKKSGQRDISAFVNKLASMNKVTPGINFVFKVNENGILYAIPVVSHFALGVTCKTGSEHTVVAVPEEESFLRVVEAAKSDPTIKMQIPANPSACKLPNRLIFEAAGQSELLKIIGNLIDEERSAVDNAYKPQGCNLL